MEKKELIKILEEANEEIKHALLVASRTKKWDTDIQRVIVKGVNAKNWAKRIKIEQMINEIHK